MALCEYDYENQVSSPHRQTRIGLTRSNYIFIIFVNLALLLNSRWSISSRVANCGHCIEITRGESSDYGESQAIPANDIHLIESCRKSSIK